MIDVYMSLYNKDWNITNDLFKDKYDNSICPCDLISFIHETNFIKKYKNKNNTQYMFLFDTLNNMTLLKKISCLKIMIKRIVELNKMYPKVIPISKSITYTEFMIGLINNFHDELYDTKISLYGLNDEECEIMSKAFKNKNYEEEI